MKLRTLGMALAIGIITLPFTAISADALKRIQKSTNDAVRKEAEGETKKAADKQIDKVTDGKSQTSKVLNKELKSASDATIEDASKKADLSSDDKKGKGDEKASAKGQEARQSGEKKGQEKK